MMLAPAAAVALAGLLLAADDGPDQVPYERIRNAAAEPGNWLTYSGNYQGHRHSPLAQIHPGNVATLKPVWVYQSRETGKLETSPIVIDGTLYITEKPHIVTALDGRTGRPLWSHRRQRARDVPTCCGDVNRGPAVLDDGIFFVTLDAHLVALDRRSGNLRWDVQVGDPRLGHSMTVAPLAVKDKIVVGIAGGEFGIRGFLDAYQAKTGKRAWRLWTVPAPASRATRPGRATAGARGARPPG